MSAYLAAPLPSKEVSGQGLATGPHETSGKTRISDIRGSTDVSGASVQQHEVVEIRIRLEAAKFPLVGDVRVADRSPALAVPFIGILGLLEVLQDQILGHGPDDGVTQQ